MHSIRGYKLTLYVHHSDRGRPKELMSIGMRSATAGPSSISRRTINRGRERTNHIVYRVADDGAIQESFELTLQTGSPRPGG